MAIGDAAAAAGMDLVPGSAAANTIDTEINKSRDYIAPVKSAIDSASGSSSAAAGTLVRRGPDANFGVPTPTASTHPTPKAYVDDIGTTSDTPSTVMRRNSAGQTAVATPTTRGQAANKGYVDDSFVNPVISGPAQFNSAVGIDGNLRASSAVDFPGVYGNSLSGSWRNVYIKSTGELGWVASSRQFKKNIKTWSPDRQAILAMRLVEFQYKVAIDPDGAIQHGLIAEELHELGLTWLVDYGTSGVPEGVRYDLISLALLSVVQDHEERLTRLEEKS